MYLGFSPTDISISGLLITIFPPSLEIGGVVALEFDSPLGDVPPLFVDPRPPLIFPPIGLPALPPVGQVCSSFCNNKGEPFKS